MAEDTANRLAAIRLQKEELELQVLQSQVARMKADALQREQERARMEYELAEHARQTKLAQDRCTHRKGGSGAEAHYKGQDPNYSVATVTLPTGATYFMCTRCWKEWHAPSVELRKVDAKAFKQQQTEYEAARAFTTDNAPIGKRLFEITKAA